MQMQIPCECGREVTAEPAQAGLQLTCTCGRPVQVPAWSRSWGGTDAPRPQPPRSGLTFLGWAFLLLVVVAVAMTSLATDVFGLEPGPDRKLVRVLLGGAALLVVAVLAGILRLLGARFFRG
jgi:hypothetical protein